MSLIEYRVKYALSNAAYWKSYTLGVIDIYVVLSIFRDFLIFAIFFFFFLPSPKKIQLNCKKQYLNTECITAYSVPYSTSAPFFTFNRQLHQDIQVMHATVSSYSSLTNSDY